MDLADTIQENNQASNQNRAKAMIFLRHHLDEGLKMEYLTVKDPLVVLPQARYDWIHLRLQDFKSISEYKSSMFKIISQLKLCGENITDHDMLEKTFSTFPASSMLLQQQYREMEFKKYFELISHLFVAEQHNDLLMKNHESRPTIPFPEVNTANYHQSRCEKSRGPSRDHGRGRGRNFNHGDRLALNNNLQHQQCKKKDEKHDVVQKKNPDNKCYRCGGKGHWSRICRTPRHLVELYQASLKEVKNNAEVNFISEDTVEHMHLDVADFFENPEGKIDHLIGDESVLIIGHPGSIMMRRIIENSNGHPLKNLKILTNDEFSCAAYCQGKLITRPSPMKVNIESPQFLERIHGDICGPIHPSRGSFRYLWS
ncbi:uncharacterized protein LOC107004028 [Solanum pennellii]|uniref:Uncharacterized protein LOC107004028 n=1 Tax=Solanum pennellii TaxID=28526 RepID=A0ABM1FJA7_SOLPN|nr:uncharacterized protein LOC107004028 [Solanum pennellii]